MLKLLAKLWGAFLPVFYMGTVMILLAMSVSMKGCSERTYTNEGVVNVWK